MTSLKQARRLKYLVELNDSGVWGDEPGGADDAIVLRSTDIALDGSWAMRDPARRSVSPHERQTKTLVEGDLVVVTSSGSPAHLGKTARVTREVAAKRPCFSNFVQRLRPNSGTESRYLYYLLNSSYGASQLEMLGTTTTGLRNLNGAILGAVISPVTSLAKQREIADFLDAETARIDALIEKKRRMIELLEERRIAVVYDGIANHATRTPLRRLFRIVNGGTPTNDGANWDGDVPWATPVDLAAVDGRRITSTERTLTRRGLESGSAAVPPGSILVSTRAPIGYVVETTSGMMALNQGCRGLVPAADLDVRYFRYQLVARRPDLVALGQGSTFHEVSSGALASFGVASPPLREQRETADRLDAATARVDGLIEGTSQVIGLLDERRRAVITAAVTGQLDVRAAA